MAGSPDELRELAWCSRILRMDRRSAADGRRMGICGDARWDKCAADDVSMGRGAPTHCGHANYWDESEGSVGTSAVGTYSPLGDSPLGLQDMSGNVFEWTSSKHSNDMYTQAIKGISWNYSSVVLPVTHRSWHYLLYWNYVSGSAAFPPVSELLNSGFCLLNSSKAASAMGRLFCRNCATPFDPAVLHPLKEKEKPLHCHIQSIASYFMGSRRRLIDLSTIHSTFIRYLFIRRFDKAVFALSA